MSELIFERANTNDADTFLALEIRSTQPKTYGPRSGVEGALREIDGNTLYFIRMDGVIAGMVGYRLRADGSVYISNLAVDPSHRRQGIAHTAMKLVLDENEHAPRIDLVAHPENEVALRLYMFLGFKVESRQENFFGDGEPRLVLVRKGDRG